MRSGLSFTAACFLIVAALQAGAVEPAAARTDGTDGTAGASAGKTTLPAKPVRLIVRQSGRCVGKNSGLKNGVPARLQTC
ncbi:MAG: hypothetical protein RIB59_04210, partial [Rhodospirillales bacterium]